MLKEGDWMARIKGKYRAVIELNLDTSSKGMLPFEKLTKKWTDEMSDAIRDELQNLLDPASCKVTQEVAEIELIEE